MSNASYAASRSHRAAPAPEPVRAGRPIADVEADVEALHARTLKAAAAWAQAECSHDATQRDHVAALTHLAAQSILLAEAGARRVDCGVIIGTGAPLQPQVTTLAQEFKRLNDAATAARAARHTALRARVAEVERFEAQRLALQAEADAP